VRQYKDLCGYDDATGLTDPSAKENVRELVEFVNGFSTPRYHIIRTKSSPYDVETRRNFSDVFGDSCAYKTYDGSYLDIEDINKVLSVPPTKNTFVFVKQLLRCSNDLKTKSNIGIVYELFTKGSPSNSVVTQGLLGRVTGYNVPNDTLVWTDIETIERYKALWDAGFSKEARIIWKSSTTKYSKGVTVSTGTYHNTISSSSGCGNAEPQGKAERDHLVCTTQAEIEILAKEMIPKSRRVTYATNADGFKMCSISNGPGVQSLAHVKSLAESKNTFSNMPKKMDELKVGEYTHRRYVCYENTNDLTTERFVIIWAKRTE
jgi:hypothetical protein